MQREGAEEVIMEQASVLQIERKHGPKRHWRKMTIPQQKRKLELKLGSDLPFNGKIFVWFVSDSVVIQPSFKITCRGHTVKPYEEITISRMSGQHDIIICGVKYGARVM